MALPVEKKRVDYTEGSILGSILKMGLPSMFGFLSQSIYTFADTFWVSRLPESEAGVAAITFFHNILWVVFSFNHLVGPGSVAVISRRYGEKDFDAAATAIKETLVLKLLFGAILGLLGWYFAEPLLRLVGAEGTALAMGVAYGRIMFLGVPIMYATYSIFTAMRGVANPNIAMGLMIGSNLLNIAVDPVFIFGWFGMPAWGIEGAAYASVGSFTLTLLIGLVLFYSNVTNVGLALRGRKPMAATTMWKIVRIGIPSWLGELSFSGSRLIITPLVATFGTAVVAAYGVGTQVFGFGIMLLVGIGLGLSSLIGHNVGSGKLVRARMTGDRAIALGVAILTVYGIIVFFGAEMIMRLFFESEDTINQGITLLRIFAIGFPFFGAYEMLIQIHSGVGLNTPAMVVAIIQAWLLQVLPIILLVEILGLSQNVIWWTFAVSGAICSIGMYWYYQRGKWLTVKV